MEGNFADELYAESLQLSKVQLAPTSSLNSKQSDSQAHDSVDLWDEEGSLEDGYDDEFFEASVFDREERERHKNFHTAGYREGIIAGQEASSQEGFNIGFKQSVLIGYNWGLVRGVTSALACLPDGLREKLIETEEQRNGFQGLFESVHSLSTTDALKLFSDEIIARKAREQSGNSSSNSLEVGFPEQISDVSALGNHFADLRSLLVKSPAINVHFS